MSPQNIFKRGRDPPSIPPFQTKRPRLDPQIRPRIDTSIDPEITELEGERSDSPRETSPPVNVEAPPQLSDSQPRVVNFWTKNQIITVNASGRRFVTTVRSLTRRSSYFRKLFGLEPDPSFTARPRIIGPNEIFLDMLPDDFETLFKYLKTGTFRMLTPSSGTPFHVANLLRTYGVQFGTRTSETISPELEKKALFFSTTHAFQKYGWWLSVVDKLALLKKCQLPRAFLNYYQVDNQGRMRDFLDRYSVDFDNRETWVFVDIQSFGSGNIEFVGRLHGYPMYYSDASESALYYNTCQKEWVLAQKSMACVIDHRLPHPQQRYHLRAKSTCRHPSLAENWELWNPGTKTYSTIEDDFRIHPFMRLERFIEICLHGVKFHLLTVEMMKLIFSITFHS